MLRTSVRGISSVALRKRIEEMGALYEAALAVPVDGTAAERAAATAEFERLVRRLSAMQHRLVNALAEVPVAELGEPSLSAALSTLLRISREEAGRRIKDAQHLGPRSAITGEALDPLWTQTAAAQARGDIGPEHLKHIRKFFKELPGFVDHDTRQCAEHQLADAACGLRPEEFGKAADRLATLLDQDGELSEADLAARSYLHVGKQRRDGTRSFRGRLDPEAGALWEAVQAKLAAPGMCNPDDESPRIDGEPTPEARTRDQRSAGQRNHDAFKAVLREVLASGQLGSHNGLPVTMVITTTLKELESGAGHAVSGGGSLLPMRDVIKQASAAHQYLCVFDDHTEEVLYLGRAKRLASKAQRIVLYARDRGCTFPGCTAPPYHCEAHHRNGDWSQGGQTNIDDLTLACGTDNRRVKPGGWSTRTRKDGRTEWLPPPNLDTGQTRVNNYHHPERYLIPDENDSRHQNDADSGDDDGEKP